MIQNHAKGKKNRDGARKKFDRRKHDMELWDIYDENKQLTGRTMKRNDWHMKPGEFHLTVLGVIARPDGTFLITKRVMTKAWAPGWWEVSGGAAQAGESSWEAVRREVREETGLDVSKADGGYLFTYRRINPDEGEQLLCRCLSLRDGCQRRRSPSSGGRNRRLPFCYAGRNQRVRRRR